MFEVNDYSPGTHSLLWGKNMRIVILQGNGIIMLQNHVRRNYSENDFFGIVKEETVSIIAEEQTIIGTAVSLNERLNRKAFVHGSGSKGILFRQTFELGLSLETYDSNRKHLALANVSDILDILLMDTYDTKHAVKNEKVISVLRTSHENLSNPDFNIYEEMKKTNYSEAYIRRLIVEETGMTPIQFLTGIRIDKAIEIIHSGQSPLSITSLAQACGFRDPLYFSRKFKMATGMSPREYIRKTEEGQNNR